VDLIWESAGMPAGAGEGLSWYTRRGTLGAVLVATTLFWLEDPSDSQADSWAFLDRRIEDVMRFGRVRAQVETLLRGVPGFRPAARRQ
jgi:ubiquinone biosynthesis protein COQ9